MDPATTAAPPAAPLPPPATQQEANDRYDSKLFGGGVDHIGDSLDAAGKETLQGLTAGEDNPKEATAQMANLSYAARHTKMDPDQLSANWGTLRDQFASMVAEKPMQNVSDTQLFDVIGKSIQERQGEQAMLGKMQQAMVHDAIEGGTSYLPTYQRMQQEMTADPSYNPKHEDQYLFAAKGAWAQIQPMAARIAPVAQMVANSFTMEAEQGNLRQSPGLVEALQALTPQERSMALSAASEMASKKISQEQDQGIAPKPGTGDMLSRGLQSVTEGAVRTGMKLVETGQFGAPTDKTLQDTDISRELEEAYNNANQPKGSGAQKAWYGFVGQLPALAGMVLQPEVGIPLALGQMADQNMGALEKRGVPQHEAFVGGLVTAAPAAAIMKLQGSILAGESMPWLGKMMAPSAKSIAGLAGKTLGQFGFNAGVLNVGQAMQDSLVPAMQGLTRQFDKAVPEVDWKKEFAQIGASRLDTFINLLPLAIVGTGAGALRESGAMRSYIGQKEFMKAAGFSEDQLAGIAKAPDAATATQLIQEAWAAPKGTAAEKSAGHAAADAKMDDAAQRVLQPGGAGIPAGDDPALIPSRVETAAQVIADANDHAAAGGEAFQGEQPAEEAPKEGAALPAEKQLEQGLATVTPGETPGIAQKVADSLKEGQKTGIAMSLPAGITDWLGDARRAAGDALKEIRADPEMTPFKTALNGLVGKMQRNTMDVRKLVETIRTMVPDRVAREGITNWIQADGDPKVLQSWHDATSKDTLKAGYKAALNLTPDQVKVAQFVQKFFADKLAEMKEHGLVEEGVKNYVNQIWKRDFTQGGDAAQFAGKIQKAFKFGKERVFGNYFEGEQAGFSPVTKDIGNLVGTYLSEANRVIAARDFINNLSAMKASDMRPLVAPFGAEAHTQVGFRDPVVAGEPGPLTRPENSFDYKVIDSPALRGWKWAEMNQESGALEAKTGQLAVHPEIARYINALVGRDRLRDWYNEPGSAVQKIIKSGLKTVDSATSQAKGMMFTLSGYHQVQESVRALGYRVNPFTELPELSSKNPDVMRSTDAGLMLAADNAGMRDFMEGYGSHDILQNIPVAGKLAQKYTGWFFESYLPRLKQKTWEAVNERNTERYADQLKSGDMEQSDVDKLSADQVNAGYGHLNYVDLGRSPTARHLARLAFLAPDFLESTGRVVAQAGKQVIGNTAGREQLQALAFLGLTQWMTCRVLNKTLDGDYHNDKPFSVVVGDREYSMRTIPGDIYQLASGAAESAEDKKVGPKLRSFVSGRFSPLVTSAWEVGTGKNYRGEQVSFTDSLRDVATNVIPMSLKPFLPRGAQGPANVPMWDQFITSNGLRISRNSDINSTFHLGQQFAKAQGVKDDSGVYPVSEWQQMRYALEDGDLTKAQAELDLVHQQNPKLAGEHKTETAFKESLFRPFTGSKKMEGDFEDQLEGRDKEVFEKAVAARAKVWSDFLSLNLGPPTAAKEEAP